MSLTEVCAERISKPVWKRSLATLSPGYFAFVMATGVVSLGAHLHGRERIADGLFLLNIGAYFVLWTLTLLRLALLPRLLIADLTHHSRGAAFLTAAAGTAVLGCQFAILTPWMGVAAGLWFLGTGLSLVLSYTFFIATTACNPKPSLQAGISGSWLLVIVAIESISVLGSLVAPDLSSTKVVLFIALSSYLAGAMLYVFFATLILYRWMFFSMQPEKLTPDYWIDMGALAITALAGTLLLQGASRWTLLAGLAPFLTGSALFFWATATWWIPLLLLVELWRHIHGRVSFVYGPEYWALVFPLGMYAVATSMLINVTGLGFLRGVADFFLYVALSAWTITFAGMIHSLIPLRFRKKRSEQ